MILKPLIVSKSERLRFVADEQQIDYDIAALEFIAKASEGGMRDALSIMDQAIAFGDDHLTLKDALDVTGSVQTKRHLMIYLRILLMAMCVKRSPVTIILFLKVKRLIALSMI